MGLWWDVRWCRRDLDGDFLRGRELFRGCGDVDLGTREAGARGAAVEGGLVSVVLVAVGKFGVGGCGVGGQVFGEGVGVGAVEGGCGGAKSWSSSRRWLSAEKAPYISCCCWAC